MTQDVFLWVFLSFLSGALPLSYWLGKLALGVDIREYGDGNPGAANVWRAGGPYWGILAILLDFFKGAVPVSIIHYLLGWDGLALSAAALAPILGHAFSPFLQFKGGKALAVTFGIWTGLSLWLVPTILGLLFALWLALLTIEGWAVMAGVISLLGVFLIMKASSSWYVAWLGMAFILTWSHRHELGKRPSLRRLYTRKNK